VLALDRDPTAIRNGKALLERFPGRLVLIVARFGDLANVWSEAAKREFQINEPARKANGLVLDVGVSSMQLDQPERGFSFLSDGPLDMRMSANADPTLPTAADLLNRENERTIADILYRYGEEKRSRAIARAIVKERESRQFTRTLELAEVVDRVIGRHHEPGRHPATRTFQALRIAVNDELGELKRALETSEQILAPGGRLAVVSFHSLEDRIVKTFLRERSDRAPRRSRHEPALARDELKSAVRFQIVNQRPIAPSDDEIAVNPRARSARLRAAIRL
jgi:16S rRNA (cytosine1402-N4)-methyltransferase